MNKYDQKFQYVDAKVDFLLDDETFQSGRWDRIHLTDIQSKLFDRSHNRENCFCTIQRFKEPTRSADALETHYCGFFFDLDAHSDGTTAGRVEAVSKTLSDANKIVQFFLSLDIAKPLIRVWFSGNKGFHIVVHPDALGITPSKHNTNIMKLAASFLKEKLNLDTLDESVYTNPRMWRLSSSRHPESGLYKTELYIDDLTQGDPYEIFNKCRKPQPPGLLYEEEEYENIETPDDARDFWKQKLSEHQAFNDLASLSPQEPIAKTKNMPVCMNDILLNGLKKPGSRNQATMVMASYFKDVGVSPQAAEQKLVDWVTRKLPNEGEKKHKERLANTRAVVKTVYNNSKYRFSCAFIKSLGTSWNRVTCSQFDKDGCDTIKGKSNEPAEVPQIPLSRASEEIFYNQYLKIPVIAVGKGEKPYVFPEVVSFDCAVDPERPVCQRCRIVDKGGHHDMAIERDSNILPAFINIPNIHVKGLLKAAAGIPKECRNVEMHIVSTGTIEEIRLQPDINMSGILDENLTDANIQDTIEEGTFCTRDGFYVGHGLEINKRYKILAKTISHPKTQGICHIFTEFESSHDDIDKFEMTEELYRALQVFQPMPGQSVREKFDEIHDDLEQNVHMIYGRREVAVAVDLVYHSVLSMVYQKKFEKKGWLELLILGDSGNGKTKMVERIMQHYQLGEITGVEGGKRTGLIWANHNVNGRYMLTWGKIPQNDRRLLVLDEFSGMPDEEVSTMTRMRTEGIAESQGINPAITTSRTRLIFLSNPRNGKPLDFYNHGIEAVNSLFKEHQDVRRLDMAVCVRSGDVSLSLINKRPDPDPSTHAYTDALCKKLVLWAWSRNSHQVVFSGETEDLISDAAIKMGKKYRCDITLVEPSDQRLKLARIACAAAARMFSTDEKGEKVIVKPEHVEFAVDAMQSLYNQPAMEYDVYARVRQKKMFMSDELNVSLSDWFRQIENYEHLLDIFLSGTYFRKAELMDLTGYDKDVMGDILKHLSRNSLIVSTGRGYRKTPMFTGWLKKFRKDETTTPDF